MKPELSEEDADAIAILFDQRRHCRWNDSYFSSGDPRWWLYEAPRTYAHQTEKFKSLGSSCHGTLLEIALMHTLRPCKRCGSDHLYVGGYKIACCSCLGEPDECEDCRNGGCQAYAENMNLRDAVTRWNLDHGDGGARGRVIVVGGG